jgi:glucuronoarabinoxylan endo-1,4-beta-xylanase
MAQGMQQGWKFVCGERIVRPSERKSASTWYAILAFVVVFAFGGKAQGQTATVTWTTTHQTIDGFGASDWGTAESLSSEEADMFFSTTAGVGLSLVEEEGNEECGYNTPPTGSGFSDLTTLQEAVARGAKVVVQMSSPPVSMKDNGSCGNGNLFPGSYSAYASYIVTWIQNLQAAGIPVSVVSPITESDVVSGAPASCPSPNTGTPNNIGGFCLTPAQIATFIKSNLGPAIASAGLSAKIRLGDEGQWFLYNYPSACMNDSACSSYVGILGSHAYGYYPNNKIGYYRSYACCSSAFPAPESTVSGQLWISEVSQSGNGNAFNGTISDGLEWAKLLHDYLTTANITGFMYWMLNGNSWFNDNEGLTDQSGNPAKRLYTIGNWSKFVRPGWVRIDTGSNDPQSGIYVSAYKDPASGTFAIVAINENGSATSQTFSLSGFPSVITATPWTTSASLNLVSQPNVAVSGNSFTYSLPEQSVTTFVGTTGASNETNPAPPSALVVVVR